MVMYGDWTSACFDPVTQLSVGCRYLCTQMKGTSKHSLACANFFIPSLLNKNVRHGQYSVVFLIGFFKSTVCQCIHPHKFLKYLEIVRNNSEPSECVAK